MQSLTANGTTFPEPYGFCNHLRPKDGIEELTWNAFQGMYDIIRGFRITLQCHELIRKEAPIGENFYSLNKWREDLAFFYTFEPWDVIILLSFAALWTFSRWFLINCIFIPLANKIGIYPKDMAKFTDSAWRLATGGSLWLGLVYIDISGNYNLIWKSTEIWSDWKVRQYPWDLKMGYFAECGYIIHAAFFTFIFEERRHDTIVMMIHHVLTLSLIICSYMTGYLKIGFLIYLLNDASDMFLDAAKVAGALTDTKKFGHSRVAEMVTAISSLGFALSWFICRIVFHLTKVWRSAAFGSLVYFPVIPGPFHIFFNILVGALYPMYVFWFMFIIIWAIDIVSGKKKMTTLNDTREFTEAEQNDTIKKVA